MEAVDSTIINTAIPVMSHSLNVYPIDLKIALISYLLSLAIFIPISGWLADKFGVRKIFISALLIFTLSSFFCGFANNLSELVIARFIQGFGGALSLPVGRLIIIRVFGRENMIVNMSRVVIVGALGLMLGPVIGGLIVHYFSWPWIFWVNIPIGLITIVLSYFWLDDLKTRGNVPPLDPLGFLLFGIGLAGFTFGFSTLSETTIPYLRSLIIILLSILILVIYFWYSHKKLHPIVKTDLLKIRTFRISITGNLLARLGFGGVPFLLPLLLQIVLGFSAQLAGLLLAPVALGVLLVKPVILRILRIFGFKRLLIFNTILAGLAIWSYIIIGHGTSPYLIAVLTFLYGFIVSIQYSAMNSLAYADVAENNLSSATSIMGTIQQVSQSFGVAVCALLVHFFTGLTGTHHELSVPIFHLTFFIVGLITIFSSLLFFRLKPQDGAQMIS